MQMWIMKAQKLLLGKAVAEEGRALLRSRVASFFLAYGHVWYFEIVPWAPTPWAASLPFPWILPLPLDGQRESSHTLCSCTFQSLDWQLGYRSEP